MSQPEWSPTRGDHVVALNTTPQPLPVPRGRDLAIETVDGAQRRSARTHAAAVTRVDKRRVAQWDYSQRKGVGN